MKTKVVALIITICFLFPLFGCSANDKDRPDSMSIFMGFSSYASFSNDKEATCELYDYLQKLTFEKTDDESDFLSSLNIVFSNNNDALWQVHVDKNGVFWFSAESDNDNDNDIQRYRVSSGEFDYNYVYDFYRNSDAVSSDDSADRSSALSKVEAEKLIQEHIDLASEDSYIYGKSAENLVEKFIPSAFEKMKLQVFDIYGETGPIGTFLICNNKVLDVFDNFENACIADIDKDGKYELISLWGWGSGIYRVQLNAYKFGNPPYFDSMNEVLYVAYSNCWVPDPGAGELRIKQVNDTDIELYLAEVSDGNYKITESFGLLRISEDKLVPSKTDDSIFKQWSDVYS